MQDVLAAAPRKQARDAKRPRPTPGVVHPLTWEDVSCAAEAEGLVLVRSDNATGFRGVLARVLRTPPAERNSHGMPP